MKTDTARSIVRNCVLHLALAWLQFIAILAPAFADPRREARLDRAPSREPPLVVSMRVTTPVGDVGERSLSEGEHLRSGQRVAIRLHVNRAAYLLVWQQAPGKTPAVLYMSGALTPIAAERMVTLPQAGLFYELPVSEQGDQQIGVLAADSPIALEKARQGLASSSAQSRERGASGDKAAKEERGPREPRVCKTQEGSKQSGCPSRGPEDWQEQLAGKDGLAKLVLSFRCTP